MPAKPPPKRSLSVKKRARQNTKLRLKNRAVRSQVQTVTKKTVKAMGESDKGAMDATLREAIKTISKAASKGILHKNTASRKIARLSKMAHKAAQPAAS